MKHAPLFLTLLFSASLLFGSEYYQSNALGQEKRAIPALAGVGYEKERDGEGNATLYLNGSVVEREQVEGLVRTITTAQSVQTFTYDDAGLLLSSEEAQDGHRETREFHYNKQGVLERVHYLRDGEQQGAVLYFLDASFRLAGVEEVSLDASSSFLYSGRDWKSYPLEGSVVMLHTYPSGLVVRDVYLDGDPPTERALPRVEGGNLVFSSEEQGNRVEKTYNSRAQEVLVVVRDATGAEIERTVRVFSRQGVEKETITRGSDTLIRTYTEGRMDAEERYEHDELRSIRFFPQGHESYEMLYRNGEEFSRITYGEDGYRILRVDML